MYILYISFLFSWQPFIVSKMPTFHWILKCWQNITVKAFTFIGYIFYLIVHVCVNNTMYMSNVLHELNNKTQILRWPWENHQPVITNKLYHIIVYLVQVHLAGVGFELTTFVVIGTDCIGSYKSNYHTITNYSTFNNISVISSRSVLLVEETGVPGENHRTDASHWQNLSHNVV